MRRILKSWTEWVEVEMYLRSRRRRADFRASKAEVYQGLGLRGLESLVIKLQTCQELSVEWNRSC